MATNPRITSALFWSKVRIPENRVDCWTWAGTLADNGYGRVWISPHWVPAHRFAYEELKEPIPDGLQVRHLCHNKLCCNPAHLDVGTAKENAQDALDAGRIMRGSGHTSSKLTEAQVLAIRQNPDRLTTTALAMRFNVSVGTISNIRNGKVWRHVAG